MKRISFYSFKGGVGRSVLLVNMAYKLASKYSKRVGLIDLDIESSGLNHILGINIVDDKHLLNFLYGQNRNVTELEGYIKTVKIDKTTESKIYLLPSTEEPELLSKLEWNDDVEAFLSEEVFPTFQKVYNLDYILIDGRTGLSKFSAFALKRSDIIFLCCRLDKQNQYGMNRMIKVCNHSGKKYYTVVSGCPMIEGYPQKIKKFEKVIEKKIDFVLPYQPELYFNETIISKTMPKSKLAKVYNTIASKIIED